MNDNQRRRVLSVAAAICTIVPGFFLKPHFSPAYLYGLVLGLLVSVPVGILIKRRKAN